MDKKKLCIEKSRELINNETFKERHRASEKYFTRLLQLFFSSRLVVILRKSVKSMQLWLYELSIELDTEPVSSAAFTKARAFLTHTAFIERGREAVVRVFYGDGDFKRYKGWKDVGHRRFQAAVAGYRWYYRRVWPNLLTLQTKIFLQSHILTGWHQLCMMYSTG